MKAVLCRAFGPPESLSVEDVAEPVPSPGEVVVEIAFAALNFFDTLIVAGRYQVKPAFPFSPAGEFSGRVAALGAGVSGFAVGVRVCGYAGYGAARQKLAIAAASLTHIPDGVSNETAAGLTIAYGTTIHALAQRARIQPGETLAVLGASGGAGLAAVEIGRLMGARVIACASSADKLATARRAGAHETIDYSAGDLRDALRVATDGKGVDVVYDAVGGSYTEPALRSLGWKGRLLVVGFAAGDIPKIPLNLTLLKGCDIVGVFWGEFVKREPDLQRRNMAQLLDWAARGDLTVPIHAVYPLEDVATAIGEIAGRRVQGKILLKP